MITSNVLARVMCIKYGSSVGTCFTIERGGRQYVVTAAHVVEGIGQQDVVAVLRNQAWEQVEVTLVGTGGDAVDVAILAAGRTLSPAWEVRLETTVVIGQDVYFLGFPFGLRTPVAHLNRGFDFPLVKKAIISSLQGRPGEPMWMMLDGINNPGFSGGPVVCTPLGLVTLGMLNSETFPVLSIVGVVSSYRAEPAAAYLDGRETPLTVQTNTGIIIAYDICHALAMIDQNPVGHLLDAAVAAVPT